MGESSGDHRREDATTDRRGAVEPPRPTEPAPVVIARPVRSADPGFPLPGQDPRRGDRRDGSGRSGADGDTVSIHIGRLDVRANLEAVEEPHARPAARDRRGPTLEDYLRGAGAGS